MSTEPPVWTTACPDWAQRLKDGRSIIPPPIFPERAAEALAVFKELRIVDAPGSPTFGESCAQWVFDFVSSVFGAYNADTGKRLITEWFLQIPKKNSKSTIAAGIMLTALVLNWRRSAAFTILAPTVRIAGNSFDPARDMCSPQSDEELAEKVQVQTHIKTITARATQATLTVLAAESSTVGGSKSVGTLVDELWLFGRRPDAANMLREATGGLASRDEGFVIFLTTQSDEPPAGVYAEKLQYARDVRDGVIVDPTFCPVIFEFPEEMIENEEHLNPKNWGMVNPNLGYSVSEEFLTREFSKAKSAGQAELRGFFAKHLNVQIGMALMANRWAGAKFWIKNENRKLTLHDILDTSDVVTGGVDGGGLDDLLGAAAIGRHRKSRKWQLWAHAWAHPSVLELRKEIAPALEDFAKDGDLTLVQQVGEDLDELADIFSMIQARSLLDKIGADPAGLGGILDALVAAKIPQDKIVGISQGWRLSGAIKTAERKLAEGMLVHCGTRLMNWVAANARVEPRGNAVVITKQVSGSAKIDPLMASLNAVTLMSLNPAGVANIDDFLNNAVIA